MYISIRFVIVYCNIIHYIVFNFVIIIVVLIFTNSLLLSFLSKFTTPPLPPFPPPPHTHLFQPPAYLILLNVPAPRLLGYPVDYGPKSSRLQR